MKRVIILLLVFIVALTFMACGDTENEGSKLNDASTESVPVDRFILGDINGLNYKNEFIGIGCELNDQWSFYTDEQIGEMNNIAMDNLDEEALEILKNANVVYDMYAERYGGIDNININLEKVNPEQLAILDIKDNFTKLAPTIVTSFENMGFSNVRYDIATRKIDGQEFECLNIAYEAEGMRLFQSTISIKCDGYLANITFTTSGGDVIDELVDMFYLIK